MDCKKDCRPYPVDPAPYAPGGCGPCKPGPHPGHRPPPPPPCPPSQYIGARYVPKFADPLEWDGAKAYENLIIVTHNNESYTSRCPVPPGIDITNERYWAKTGAYNAQLEQLKEGVSDLSSQVTGFAEDNKEFREKITQFEKDNADMKNTVAKNDARVDNLAERVATAETEIDGLQATTAQHTTEIADLHAKDEDLQRQITSNDNDIAALQAKDVEQDSRLNGIDTKLKSHDATLAQNTADIAKNTKNIQDNAAQIAVNAHELADHAEQLKDHEARLTAQHKEITDNHTAIERNTSDIAGLRSDLTEDEAKIEANRDAIAHIQEKDVQQDGRLDALEKRTTTAEGRLDGLDTKTDNTNTALAAEVDRAKAAELAQGKLIAKNAAELADHATELADHEQRITALETDNTKNKQDITDIEAKNVAQDTAISAAKDAAAHAQETADTADGKADANATTIGSWEANHPGKTISEAVTDANTDIVSNATQITNVKNDLSATNEKVTGLENTKADKTDIPDVSNFVTKAKFDERTEWMTEQLGIEKQPCISVITSITKTSDITLNFSFYPLGGQIETDIDAFYNYLLYKDKSGKVHRLSDANVKLSANLIVLDSSGNVSVIDTELSPTDTIGSSESHVTLVPSSNRYSFGVGQATFSIPAVLSDKNIIAIGPADCDIKRIYAMATTYYMNTTHYE